MRPMLATLHKDAIPKGDWVFERKLDGVRCIARIRDGEVTLHSRNQKLMPQYPEINRALNGSPDMVIDGEIIAFEKGVPSFSRLQGRMQLSDPQEAMATGIPVEYHIFDILSLEGQELTKEPLTKRKAVLAENVHEGDMIRLAEEFSDGEELFSMMCRQGWEGIIAKRPQSTYQPRRSNDWLKIKCTQRQEFIIGGYTDPQGSRSGLGALLLGYYDEGKLRYAGKVGTGFTNSELLILRQALENLAQEEAPFIDADLKAHWVEPRLVGEVAFTEWTGDGRLRHPSFIGLRSDKPPEAVVRE